MIFASILALALAPLLFRFTAGSVNKLSFLEGFIFVSILGLVGLHFIPNHEHGISLFGALALVLGLIGPVILENLLKKACAQIHGITLLLALIGLAIHTAVDGAALSDQIVDGSLYLPFAVVLHRLPVGLTIWWLLEPHFGKRIAWGALIGMCLSTLAGYFSYTPELFHTHSTLVGIVQLFVAGSILHVVIFKFHLTEHAKEHAEDTHTCCDHDHSKAPSAFFEFLGNIAACLLLFYLSSIASTTSHAGHSHTHSMHSSFFETFYTLAMQSAPALAIAYIASIFLFTYLTPKSVTWLSKGNTLAQATKGVAVGLPLPICSCGILPFYQTLISKGVPSTAAIAFLIATPELGLDAVFISLPLLGTKMTVIRVSCAVLFAFAVALLMSRLNTKSTVKDQQSTLTESSLIDGPKSLKAGARFSFIDLVDHTGPWILLGLLVAAAAEPFVQSLVNPLTPFLQILIYGLLGIIVYVCASGATPLVAILLAAGLSPGAAVTFLLTGPATNISTFGVLSKLHSKRFALLFAITAFLCAIALGLAINIFFSAGSIKVPTHAHEHLSWYHTLSFYFIALLLLYSVMRRGAKGFIAELF